MRFGVEDYFAEIERLGRSKQQVEVFEGLGKQEALHRVGFFFCDDALQRGVAFFSAAVFDEVAPHRLAHFQISGIFGEVIEIVGDRSYFGSASRDAGPSFL